MRRNALSLLRPSVLPPDASGRLVRRPAKPWASEAMPQTDEPWSSVHIRPL